MDKIAYIFNSVTFITVLSGVIVFMLSQLFVELFIKPLSRYKSVKANIIFFLYRYREPIFNPINYDRYEDYIHSEKEHFRELGQDYKMAQIRGKEIASELAEFLENRGICFIIPKRRRIREGIDSLLWLSDCIVRGNSSIESNCKSYKSIISNLKLYGIEKWKRE